MVKHIVRQIAKLLVYRLSVTRSSMFHFCVPSRYPSKSGLLHRHVVKHIVRFSVRNIGNASSLVPCTGLSSPLSPDHYRVPVPVPGTGAQTRRETHHYECMPADGRIVLHKHIILIYKFPTNYTGPPIRWAQSRLKESRLHIAICPIYPMAASTSRLRMVTKP